jgi:hypothetical protein
MHNMELSSAGESSCSDDGDPDEGTQMDGPLDLVGELSDDDNEGAVISINETRNKTVNELRQALVASMDKDGRVHPRSHHTPSRYTRQLDGDSLTDSPKSKALEKMLQEIGVEGQELRRLLSERNKDLFL